MADPKWTPGPWRVERRAEDEWWIMAGDTLVAVVYADDAEEGQANANLISAVHGLREACEAAWEELMRQDDIDKRVPPETFELLETALRKARGEDA